MPNLQAMNELKALLVKNFPDDIEKVLLFGSQIGNTPRKDSDYDILIVLKKPYSWRLKNRIYDKTWEIDFKYDILTDIRLISKGELDTIKGKQPFITEAIEKGMVL
jgi:predicted nucleotidyltransferase